MNVIKRNGSEQEFNIQKIERAICLANNHVEESDKMNDEQIQKVIQTVLKKLEGFNSISVEDIHDFIEQSLVRHNKWGVSKAYMLGRDEKRKKKKYTENEEKAIALINGNSELRGDNANKRIDDNGAISDYFAGILTKSINDKIITKDIIEADKKGLIHWHDKDYSPIRPMHNCDLINGEDMLNNFFVMGTTLIKPNDETPFRTACNLFAQINLIVSGRQYGGQTISWAHVLPFIEQSRRIIRKDVIEDYEEDGTKYTDKMVERKVNKKLRKEIKEGVKIYQYQVLCHSSSNGQTPFVSNNLCLREAETQQELEDFAMLIEEIFKRRIKGVQDESGHYITPLFPKLLYWTCDGLNVNEDDPYFYLTQLATLCEIARTQPDIVSEPETRKVKEGQIIPSMGCRSLLGPIWEEHTYPIDTEFYYVKGVGTYPYGKFVNKKTFKDFENREYKTGYEEGEVSINFRGNTGWLVSKSETEVVIKQPIVYGRWNNGVVTINLPHVALEARENIFKNLPNNIAVNTKDVIKEFYTILTDRLELVHKALKIRYEWCSKIKSINSEILWRYGALARLGKDETVGDLMKKYPQRASISVGYVGLYETCRALINESNTSNKGRKLSKEILTFMNNKCNEWKKIDNINYSIYGTPEESLTYKFAQANRKDFGLIEYITDKDYVVNSYHVDPRENIDAFKKLEIEGEYLALSSGGAVSYVETSNLENNPYAIIKIIQWMHNHIVYAEFNRRISLCKKCGYTGDIELVKTDGGDFKFICPNCGNTDDTLMDITSRICGYLGKVTAGNTNKGRLDDIFHRILHTDCYEDDFTNIRE